jgi:hypothetical protein
MKDIPVNELRINDFILDDENNIVKIEQISGDNIHCFTQVSKSTEKLNRVIYSSNIFAIPLTKSILLKCGFKFDCDLKKSLVNTGIWFNIDNMEATYLSQKLIRIKYVHQLQNLYFALTGKELQVNL